MRVTALASPLLLAIACSIGVLVCAPSAAAHSIYISNSSSGTVTALNVGAGGAISPIPGSPFAVGFAPVGVAVSPDAEHLYVSNLESNTVSAFDIAPDGSLAPVPGSPFSTGAGPWGAAVSPDGSTLYVTNSDVNQVSAYSIAPDGSLDPVPGSPFPTGGVKPNGVAVTPDGAHLYVTNMGGGGSVSAFSVAADGSLSSVLGSPFEAGATARPVSVTPNGEYLYVGNATAEDLSVYSIGLDGALSQVAGSPFATEGAPLGLAITPDASFLYTAHIAWESNVWGYSIGADGALSSVPGAPFPTGGFRGNSAIVSPDGERLYTTNSGSGDLSVFTISANGSLSTIKGSPFDAGSSPIQLAETPDQGPFADFSATPRPAGDPSSFDASASSDSDGRVVSYEWDFGDGQSEVTATATTAHVYESAGEYAVTLTAIDDEGCSTTQTFTGQTVGCNGSNLAQRIRQIEVPPGKPLSVSLSGSGSGSVTSSPPGLDCPELCTYAFEPGTQVELVPRAASGSTFTGWSGAGCSGTGTCRLIVDGPTDVSALFSASPSADSAGTVTAGNPEVLRVHPRLRIGRVRATSRSGCGTALRQPGSGCAQPKIIVWGGIAKAAQGAVRLTASSRLRGRRVTAARWARIVDGRWRARLPFPWLPGKGNGAIFLAARFGGSSGVRSGYAKRHMRVVPPT